MAASDLFYMFTQLGLLYTSLLYTCSFKLCFLAYFEKKHWSLKFEVLVFKIDQITSKNPNEEEHSQSKNEEVQTVNISSKKSYQ